MDYSVTRIAKLRDYLVNVIYQITSDNNFQINADMLSNDVNNYSLDKIPTQNQIEKWIIGTEIKQDVYSFRSRMYYSIEAINNLENIGFFEKFEDIIKSNNEQGILPNITNIESIRCLNCGTMKYNDTNTAEFDIQIQIVYRESEEEPISL